MSTEPAAAHSPLLAKNILQGRVIEHRLSQQTLALDVLALQRLESRRLRDLKATEFCLRVPIRRITDARLAEKIGGLAAGSCFLEYLNDLLFGKSVLHICFFVNQSPS